MSKYNIPQTLDEPFKLILWTVDEVIVFVVPFLLFLLSFDKPLIGVMIGGLLIAALKKIKGEQGHYFLYHYLYWHLPFVSFLLPSKISPPAYIRAWIG